MKIKIPRVAFGSYTNKLGDTRLYYTEGCSDKTRYVKSEFQDARHVLSKEFASILWQYGADKDVFRLKHVQGWNVHFEAEARIYPYRAAFEVARQDMEKLNQDHLLVGRFIEAIPQNTQYKDTDLKEGAEELELNVNEQFVPSTNPDAKCLSDWMKHYFLTEGKRLCVELDMTGKNAFGKEVFQLPEFRTLLAAIELLPVELARFVSFGFAMDDNYPKFATDNFLNVVVKGSKFASSGDMKTWEEVTKVPCSDLTTQQEAFNGLKSGVGIPSGTNTLDSLLERLPKQVRKYKQIINAAPSSLKDEDWDIWLCKHTFNEIKVAKWSEFEQYRKNIPQKLQKEFVMSQKALATSWPLNENLMSTHVEKFGFDDKEMKMLRNKAVSEYLLSGCTRFTFLFPEDCDYDFKTFLTEEFLSEQLKKNPDSFDNWWRIFSDRKCMNAKIREIFKKQITGKKYTDLNVVAVSMKKLDSLGIESCLKDYGYTQAFTEVTDLPDPTLYKKFPKANQEEIKTTIEAIYNSYKKGNSDIVTFLALVKTWRGEKEKMLLNLFSLKDVTGFLENEEKTKFWNLAEMLLLNRNADIPLLKDKRLHSALLRAIVEKCPDVLDLIQWDALLSSNRNKLGRVLAWILKWKISHMDEKELLKFHEKVGDMKNMKDTSPLELLLKRVQSFLKKDNPNEEEEKKEKKEEEKKEEGKGKDNSRKSTVKITAEKPAAEKKPAEKDAPKAHQAISPENKDWI